jgi:hypothetical protein
MPDRPPVKGSVGVIVIGSVTIEAKTSIAVRGPGISDRAASNVGVSPVYVCVSFVDIYILTIINIDVCIPLSVTVDVHPVVVGIPIPVSVY